MSRPRRTPADRDRQSGDGISRPLRRAFRGDRERRNRRRPSGARAAPRAAQEPRRAPRRTAASAPANRFRRRHRTLCRQRVDEDAAALHAIIEMRPGRQPARSHAADQIALPHVLTRMHGDRGEVHVLGLEVIGMPQVNEASRAPRQSQPPRRRRQPRRRRARRRARDNPRRDAAGTREESDGSGCGKTPRSRPAEISAANGERIGASRRRARRITRACRRAV